MGGRDVDDAVGGTETDEPDDEVMPRSGATSVAVSAGVALAAVAVSVYAFVRRVPSGAIADHIAPATQLLAVSLGLIVVAAIAVISIGVQAVAGRPMDAPAGTVLALVSAVTAYAYLGSTVEQRGALVTGPGTHDVVDLARMSWVLLVAASLVLLAATVAARPLAQPRRRSVRVALTAATAIGLVVAVAFAFGVTTMGGLGQARATTAEPIAVPAMPQTVGTDVAYELMTTDAALIVPAGPGFVAPDADALVAYDGETGAARWRLPFDVLPKGCALTRVAATATDDAVVIAECHRTPFGVPDNVRRPSNERESVLVGIDAMTGTLLWTNDGDWRLRSTASLPLTVVPVVNTTHLGAIDPRTGQPRWTWPFADADDECRGNGFVDALEHSVIYMTVCDKTVELHRFDPLTGAERTSRLPVPVESRSENLRLDIEPLALDGDIALIQVMFSDKQARMLLAVDVETAAVQTVEAPVLSADSDDRDRGQYPGPVLQIGDSVLPPIYTDLHLVSGRKTLRAADVRTFSTDDIPSGQRWAAVGDSFVTAAGYVGRYENRLISVGSDGSSAEQPTPCGEDVGGVIPVPGAVLVACARKGYSSTINGFDVFALR